MTFGQGEPEATQEKRNQQNKCPNPLACWSMFNSWLSGKFLKFMVSAHFSGIYILSMTYFKLPT